jgi:hypothetical protein
LGSGSLKTYKLPCLLALSAETIGLFVFPDGLTLTLDTFFGGLEENLPSERFLPLWGGGAGNNFNAEGQHINIVTTKSSRMVFPTRCFQVRRKPPGPSATAWSRSVASVG